MTAAPLSLPNLAPRELASFARIRGVPECSGIVASRKYPGLYWTHSDSGNDPLLYAVDATGAIQGRPVAVTGAGNVDWEDIALDAEGNLWIADIGNNLQFRTDLSVWVVPEPDPYTAERTPRAVRHTLRYPDQRLYPSPGREFDAEALFVAYGRVYLLTKRRGDSTTVLYRLPPTPRSTPRDLERLATFDIEGLVTAADVSPDGNRLLVLTYTSVWLFDARDPGTWFDGTVRWLPVRADTCEAAALDRDGSIIIADEAGHMYRLRTEDLVTVRP